MGYPNNKEQLMFTVLAFITLGFAAYMNNTITFPMFMVCLVLFVVLNVVQVVREYKCIMRTM